MGGKIEDNFVLERDGFRLPQHRSCALGACSGPGQGQASLFAAKKYTGGTSGFAPVSFEIARVKPLKIDREN